MSKCGVAKGWTDVGPMVDIYRDALGTSFVAASDIVHQLGLLPAKEHTAVTKEMVDAPAGSIVEFQGKRKGLTAKGVEYLSTQGIFAEDESVHEWLTKELLTGLQDLDAASTLSSSQPQPQTTTTRRRPAAAAAASQPTPKKRKYEEVEDEAATATAPAPPMKKISMVASDAKVALIRQILATPMTAEAQLICIQQICM